MADAAEDQLSYFIKDEQAFGKIVCSAKTLDENLLEGNPCEFEVVPKGNQKKNLSSCDFIFFLTFQRDIKWHQLFNIYFLICLRDSK